MSKPIIALLYDFDKTLCTQDMQNYAFIPSLGMTPEEFRKKKRKKTEKPLSCQIGKHLFLLLSLFVCL